MIIITFDFLFRVLTLLIFFGWWLFWMITEREADREKPKTSSEQRFLQRWILRIVEGIVIFQVLGLQLLPLPGSSFIPQLIGFILVVIGVVIAVSARRTIGTNWAHAFEYQVKKKQELVTTGVYSFIRHPIYAGLCLALMGGELVAHSYLVFVGIVLFVFGYTQARREEKLLLDHFGERYKTYMKRTKKFIPYLW